MRQWMTELTRLLAVACALLAPSAAAAQLDTNEFGERSPRFLFAADSKLVPVGAEQVPVLGRRLRVDFDNITVKEALGTISTEAELDLVYGDVVPLDRRVRIHTEAATVAALLKQILDGMAVDVVFNRGGGASLVKRDKVKQVGAVGGRITAAEGGRPLAGATVEIKGTGLRAVTNDSGAYLIRDIPAGQRTLFVRFIGYRPAEVPVTVQPDVAVRLNVALETAALNLQELVTTATGRQRRMDVANQVTTIRADSIAQTQPIKDLTDLLETRAPGLAALPTTGAPGDPTRLRLRGTGSILLSNDPIVIVDGVRIYAEQSAPRSNSLGLSQSAGGPPAPSPLDRIDPNSIETVEVLNGPSAATIYGADAANGVIVITTKRGRPGPAKWDVSVTHGRSHMPGRFPDTYFAFGHSAATDLADCSIPRRLPCTVDSVVAYQALNDPAMTVLGGGNHSTVSATVSGGREDIRYSISGTYTDEMGLLTLPQYEADRFRATFGREPENWMKRPHQLTRWGVTGRFDFNLAESADVGITMGLAGDEQRRSSLERQLGVMRRAYVDPTTGMIFQNGTGATLTPGTTLVPEFYRSTTNTALQLLSSANLTWRPFRGFTVRADAGINAEMRRTESLLPRGLVSNSDSLGSLSTGQGTATVGTLNVGASQAVPLGWGFRLDAAVGFNLNSRSVADLVRVVGDPAGGRSTTGQSSQNSDRLTSYGWYVEPRLVHKRFSLATGLRVDGGSNYGTSAGGFALPKLGGSWLISDEPFFPFKHSRVLGTLRLRAAYGQAGVQPGVADRLRLYSRESHSINGQPVDVSTITTLGNTKLRPERSSELEGGFDADLFDARVSLSLTGYRKTKDDALLSVPVPPSLGSGTRLVNIGVVRNTGLELMLGTDLLRSDALTWRTDLQLSRNRNVVVSLADGVEAHTIGSFQRVVAGYPLFGFWQRPVLGYDDRNGDGILETSEVLVGDSAAYLGTPEPDYSAALHTTVGLFEGALTVSASFAYQDGFTQYDRGTAGPLARAAVDPSAPLVDQALVVAYNRSHASGTSYGYIQTVSMLRFNSLSIGWRIPQSVTRWVGAERGSLAVQGTNLGLRTSYQGKDPLVNSNATGNAVSDGGALPRPREWQVRLNLSY